MKTYLFGHTSFETAYEIKDYPYGRLRTSMFVYIESEPKKGDRVVRVTINPKNGRINAPKKSTYSPLYVLFLNSENGHIESDCIGRYTEREKIEAFVQAIGGEEKLTEAQRFNLAEMFNIGKVINRAPVKGADYRVSFEKCPKHIVDGVDVNEGGYSEAKITFDRPDGVAVKEIFQAIKGIKPEKLAKVWAGWQSRHYGVTPGFIRVCIRGGFQLTTVRKETFEEWMASDAATVEA